MTTTASRFAFTAGNRTARDLHRAAVASGFRGSLLFFAALLVLASGMLVLGLMGEGWLRGLLVGLGCVGAASVAAWLVGHAVSSRTWKRVLAIRYAPGTTIVAEYGDVLRLSAAGLAQEIPYGRYPRLIESTSDAIPALDGGEPLILPRALRPQEMAMHLGDEIRNPPVEPDVTGFVIASYDPRTARAAVAHALRQPSTVLVLVPFALALVAVALLTTGPLETFLAVAAFVPLPAFVFAGQALSIRGMLLREPVHVRVDDDRIAIAFRGMLTRIDRSEVERVEHSGALAILRTRVLPPIALPASALPEGALARLS